MQKNEKVADINALRKKRNRKNNNKNHTMSKYLLLLTLILAMMLFGLTRLFTIREIVVEGNELYSKDEVIRILEIDEEANIIEVYMNAHRDFEEFPYLNSFEMSFLSYDKIKITVHEKQIIGYIEVMDTFLCVDKDGFIVDQKVEQELDPNLVIIEGLNADALIMGERINLPQETIDTCLRFYQAGRKYKISLKHIRFIDGNLDRIQLTSEYIIIEFGSRDNFNKKIQFIQKMMLEVPEKEYGTLSLDEDGESGFFQKKDTQM